LINGKTLLSTVLRFAIHSGCRIFQYFMADSSDAADKPAKIK